MPNLPRWTERRTTKYSEHIFFSCHDNPSFIDVGPSPALLEARNTDPKPRYTTISHSLRNGPLHTHAINIAVLNWGWSGRMISLEAMQYSCRAANVSTGLHVSEGGRSDAARECRWDKFVPCLDRAWQLFDALGMRGPSPASLCQLIAPESVVWHRRGLISEGNCPLKYQRTCWFQHVKD